MASREGGDGTSVAWELLALCYGLSPRFPTSTLVAHAPRDARAPAGWYFWLLRSAAAVVLVDTGFADPERARAWGLEAFHPPLELLASVGVTPSQVEHVVLTHGHWDHCALLPQFDRATVWLQAGELEWMRAAVADGRHAAQGVDVETVWALEGLAAAGRLQLLPPRRMEILPGVWAVPGGAHTPGSQWLVVQGTARRVVLASDAAYLDRNVRELLPIGACGDPAANRAALVAMRSEVARPDDVIPGHDPTLADRLRQLAPGVLQVL